MKNFSKQLARGILLFCFLCSACVSLERSYPEKHYFVIEMPRSADPSESAGDRILSVANLRISPRYADKSFVYRTSDSGYEADFYNQFLTSPDTMISEELRKGLAASREFKYVLGPSDQQQPNYVLEGSVNALYGQRFGGMQPDLEIAELRDREGVLAGPLELAVRPGPRMLIDEGDGVPDGGAGNSGIVTQKRYVKSVPIRERSPEALVKGWDQALEALVSTLAVDLKAANL